MQEVCEKAGDLFACAYYGPGSGQHAQEPRAVFERRAGPRADAVRAWCAQACLPSLSCLPLKG